MNVAATFTASELSQAAGAHSQTRISRQGVAKWLGNVPSDSVKPARGNRETAAWSFGQLPESLRQRLETTARLLSYCNADAMLVAMFVDRTHQWAALDSLCDVADDELNKAAKLRDVLAPALREPSRPAAERDAMIVARYGDTFGQVITTDYARKLYQRALDRDSGNGDFSNLALYLPDKPRRKEAAAWIADVSNLADLLPMLDSAIQQIKTPASAPRPLVKSVWRAACDEYTRLIADGTEEYRAARMIRDFLHARAPFLPRNRDTLLKAWNGHLARFIARQGMPGWSADGRCNNGPKVTIPEADIARLRWSAAFKTSGRLDAAWREEYEKLSESTRAHGPKSGRCPQVVVKAVNRILLDGLVARRKGRRYLEKMLGTMLRDVETIPAMYAWVMDDLTCTLEVYATNADGTTSLHLIQLIAVLDVRSRRVVGWAASLDAAPSAELVCEAFLDAVRRTKKIPHHLFLENGWVFGRAGNVVGKRNESGDVVIAGLAEYGCQVQHFTPATPTAKGELEKTFDLLQRHMERHPGFTGREQRHDAPEQFRREQIEMRRKANPRDPATCRYDFPQGVRALEKIIEEHNATPQKGALKGMTPDEAFLSLQDRDKPPTWLPDKLHWLLAYKYRITVKHSGVGFTHFGEKIRVRGGKLASLERIGREFWAVLDSRAADCVTFMSLDFGDVFTEPLRPVVPYDISESDPDSNALETELRTKAEQRGVFEDQYHGLMDRFGDPRKELLREAQAATRERLELDAGIGLNAKIPFIESNVRAAGEEGQRQRAELRARKPRTAKPAARIAGRNGITLTQDTAARPGIDDAMKSILGTGAKDESL